VANPTKKDRDEITVAKSIFDEIVEFTEAEPVEETPKQSRARKGGVTRAANLTPKERSNIAKRAATTRWAKGNNPDKP
jgi:hypothetical protein